LANGHRPDRILYPEPNSTGEPGSGFSGEFRAADNNGNSGYAEPSALSLALDSRQLPQRITFLLRSIVAASVATFSLANGMLLWPLLVLAAPILKMKRRTSQFDRGSSD
jgi:hypothetical protein